MIIEDVITYCLCALATVTRGYIYVIPLHFYMKTVKFLCSVIQNYDKENMQTCIENIKSIFQK